MIFYYNIYVGSQIGGVSDPPIMNENFFQKINIEKASRKVGGQ